MRKLLIITQKVDENDQLLGFFTEWLKRLNGKLPLSVLCLEKGSYELPGISVESLGKENKNSKLAQGWNFYRHIIQNRHQYDSVFVHMNPIWVVLGGWYWRLTGKKIILWYTSKGVTLKLRLALWLSHIVITASPESFRLRSKKVVVTGHGIDTDLFKPNPELKKGDGPLKILSVGRIAPVKNYDILIDAAKILADKCINFGVTLVGEPALKEDKDYEESLRFKVKSLELEDNFNFVGKVNHKDLPAYYQSHNLFIHLSKTGSLDKTLLEAMACGMNVLSSNDAAKSFLPAELLFKNDDSAELAQKIELISNKNYGQDLRKYVVENHSLDKLIDKICNETSLSTIAIYPFPYSSSSNKYISLLYSNIEGKNYNNTRLKVVNSKSFFKLLFRKAGIIHIHWTNVIYGSKFFVRTLTLMAWNFIILWLLKIKGHRIVWTKHNYYPHESKWIWLDKIGQWFLFKTADVVTVHQKGEQNKKVVFIPHGNYINTYGPMSNKGTEIKNRFGFKEGDIVLVSIGAIKPYKKIENIIAAFNDAKTNGVKLLIAGKCDREYVKKLKTSINDNIKLDCNFIPDDEIPNYLAAADYSVFWYDDSVLTSGGIVLSLSYGIPVIVRNISAADLVKDGGNGLLFNNEQELSDIIKNLPNVPKFDSDKVISTVSDFGWDKISDEFAKLYYSLWN